MPSSTVSRSISSAVIDKRYLEHSYTLSDLRLNQVHDRCKHEAEGRITKPNYGLIYMLYGNGFITIDGTKIALDERHLILIKPNLGYHIESNSSHAIRFITVEVQPKSNRLDAVFEYDSNYRVVHDRVGMDELIFKLLSELQVMDKDTAIMLDSLLNHLLILIKREFLGRRAARSGKEKIVNKKELVYQTIQYIDQHLELITDLGQLAEQLGYSYSHLSHAFRSEMGIALQNYWSNRRMMRAMNRLQSGRSSITEISENLHYRSIHSFSKAFKKVTGFTPSEYQSLYGDTSFI